MQSAQHDPEHPCMGDNCNVSTIGLCFHRQKPHFIQHPLLKITEVFPVRCGQAGTLGNPAPCIGLILPFDLSPGKTFPFTKVNLTQPGTSMAVDTKPLGNRPARRMGAPQIARVNYAEVLRPKSIDEFRKVCSATSIQFWVGVAAKSPSHVRLRVANENEFAHTAHTPQK
jgi:hypothetical protein